MRLLFTSAAFLVLLLVGPVRADKLVLVAGGGAGGLFIPLVLGAVLLVSFVLAERRSKAPMMPLNVFTSLTFSGVNILTLLLSARDENGEPLTNRELRDELVTVLLAGHETTANSIGWAFERLLRGWRSRGVDLIDMAAYAATLSVADLPRCEMVEGSVEGRSGLLACQGVPKLAAGEH